jgi:hypothetical protein
MAEDHRSGGVVGQEVVEGQALALHHHPGAGGQSPIPDGSRLLGVASRRLRHPAHDHPEAQMRQVGPIPVGRRAKTPSPEAAEQAALTSM